MKSSTNKISTIYEAGWINRIKPPEETNNHGVIFLIHGWTGDEHSMWVFTRKLPQNNWLIAVRGPISTPLGGYGWVNFQTGKPHLLSDYQPVAEKLYAHLKHMIKFLNITPSSINLMGFSQGAAMTYSLTLLHPEWINKAAGMSGFLPQFNKNEFNAAHLLGKPLFISHGTVDQIVPVTKSREAAATLQKLGADIQYCESETGHKLSPSCFNQLQKFFSKDV